ncbi:MAG: MerC domain-containing protein [Acidobacteria bacterium]|nr:MerC domain-containing protein [Acidobacteriota bacterium]
MKERIARRLDALGIAASWTCAAHCLILPFFVAFLPIFGLGFLLDETTEKIFIGISSLLAAASLLPAYFREHRRLQPVLFAFGGIGLIVLTHLMFEERRFLKFSCLLGGAILLSSGHLLNLRFRRRCPHC